MLLGNAAASRLVAQLLGCACSLLLLLLGRSKGVHLVDELLEEGEAVDHVADREDLLERAEIVEQVGHLLDRQGCNCRGTGLGAAVIAALACIICPLRGRRGVLLLIAEVEPFGQLNADEVLIQLDLLEVGR